MTKACKRSFAIWEKVNNLRLPKYIKSNIDVSQWIIVTFGMLDYKIITKFFTGDKFLCKIVGHCLQTDFECWSKIEH